MLIVPPGDCELIRVDPSRKGDSKSLGGFHWSEEVVRSKMLWGLLLVNSVAYEGEKPLGLWRVYVRVGQRGSRLMFEVVLVILVVSVGISEKSGNDGTDEVSFNNPVDMIPYNNESIDPMSTGRRSGASKGCNDPGFPLYTISVIKGWRNYKRPRCVRGKSMSTKSD